MRHEVKRAWTARWEEREQVKAGGEIKGGGFRKFSGFFFFFFTRQHRTSRASRKLLIPGKREKLGKSFMISEGKVSDGRHPAAPREALKTAKIAKIESQTTGGQLGRLTSASSHQKDRLNAT